MNISKFEELVAGTKLKERAKRLAYLVLVEGRRTTDVAQQEGVSRQLVHQAEQRVLRQQMLTEKIPEDWVRKSYWLPPNLAQAVNWIEEQARVRAGVTVKADKPTPDLSAKTVDLLVDLIAGRRRRPRPKTPDRSVIPDLFEETTGR